MLHVDSGHVGHHCQASPNLLFWMRQDLCSPNSTQTQPSAPPSVKITEICHHAQLVLKHLSPTFYFNYPFITETTTEKPGPLDSKARAVWRPRKACATLLCLHLHTRFSKLFWGSPISANGLKKQEYKCLSISWVNLMPQGPLWKTLQQLGNRIQTIYSQAEKQSHVKLQGVPRNLLSLMRTKRNLKRIP